ncbi:TRAP transporter substrate-binding protein [Varunaivibrio sulfuroxidans]|uniref:Secreted protein n=1 Tax=Varunaivibrio sulfuroxidans TaxID=1773489 RepID=A0A4R3JDA1_9PROT|nr:TRAP transporter substrate-binding protein [Varunaivibrio sulfuroxidans]TCS64009.1 secreted protein [Varunaivibrio sulfuroxidans]WES31539.1 TRAP transporter substrate-binding protein [Varunaivibrio sulfuroxidans]
MTKAETKSASEGRASKAVSRRKFMRAGAAVAGAAGAAVAGVAMPNVSRAATTVLKMQGAWGSGIFKEFALDYVNRVNEMSAGRLKIDYLDVGAVLKTPEIQTGVHKGVVDAGHLVTAYWYSKHPAASLFGTGPCWGWDANQMLAWVKYGGGRAYYDKLLQEVLRLNLVGFLSGPMQAQPFGWFKKPINGIEDIKGLKYRTVGLAADVLNEMGMSVVQIPGGEIQPSMERGVIDAAEFNNPTSDKDFGMQDVAKEYYLASFHQSQESFEIIFNKERFESLSKEEQKILEYASESASSDMSWKSIDRYAKDLVLLETKYGVHVHRTDESIMAGQLAAWDVVIKRFADADPFFKEIVESQKAWAKRTMGYTLTNAPDYKLAFDHYFPGVLA